MAPIVIGIGLGLLWWVIDNLEGGDNENAENGNHSSSGGTGGKPNPGSNPNHGDGSLDRESILTDVKKEIGEMKDVFENEFNAFRSEFGHDLSGEQNTASGNGKAETVIGDKNGEKKKPKKETAPTQ